MHLFFTNGIFSLLNNKHGKKNRLCVSSQPQIHSHSTLLYMSLFKFRSYILPPLVLLVCLIINSGVGIPTPDFVSQIKVACQLPCFKCSNELRYHNITPVNTHRDSVHSIYLAHSTCPAYYVTNAVFHAGFFRPHNTTTTRLDNFEKTINFNLRWQHLLWGGFLQ